MVFQINEIFKSIHGEGRMCGRPMLFVRFAGCNQTCSFCDTDHSIKRIMEADDIEKELIRLDPDKHLPVCLTGGEPMRQIHRDWSTLIEDRPVVLETNGTIALPDKLSWIFEGESWITISPKGNANDCLLHQADELRFVWPHPYYGVEMSALYDDLRTVEDKSENLPIIYFSPKWGKDGIDPTNTDKAAEACIHLASRGLDARMSLQGHKIWRIK